MVTIDYLKYGAVVAIVGAVYIVGYKHAESEGEREMESLKMQHAQAIIDAQEKEKANYEKTIQSLIADLDRARSERDNRMHELESFRSRATDNETCRRQRSDLARIAVGLEGVASRAILFISGGSK